MASQRGRFHLDLRRQLAIARRRLPLLIISVVLASATAYIGANLQPKVYESDATLIVGESLSAASPDYNQLLASQRLSKTYASVATTRPRLENVIKKLGLSVGPEELAKHVRATAPLDSTLLTITASDQDPARAAAIANAMADELIAASPGLQGGPAEDIQSSVRADLTATQDLIQTTQAEVEALTAVPNRTPEEDANLSVVQGRVISLRQTYATLLTFLSGNAANFLSTVEPAVPSLNPVSPRPLLSLILGAFLGLMIAATIAFAVEYLDDTVKTSADVQELLGLPTLGGIARVRRRPGGAEMYQLVSLLYPRSGAAEAYRTLRTNIEFAAIDAPIRTLLVTSAISGEGKTVSSANLAIVFAQAGQRVLLVDGDLRNPGTHLIFNVSNDTGLTDLLRSDGADADEIVKTTEVDNLRILTTGAPAANPAELLGSQRMRSVLERLKSEYDLVIFDSPPLHAVADGAVLSSFLDATLLVIQSGRSRRAVIRSSGEALARADARVLGAVLNRVPEEPSSDFRHYYDEAAPSAPVAAAVGGDARAGSVTPLK